MIIISKDHSFYKTETILNSSEAGMPILKVTLGTDGNYLLETCQGAFNTINSQIFWPNLEGG